MSTFRQQQFESLLAPRVMQLSGMEQAAFRSFAEDPYVAMSFGQATMANLRMNPTQRAMGYSGFMDYAANALSVMLPEWAGGVTAEEFDSVQPSGLPEPFNIEEHIKRLQPRAQELAIKLAEDGAFNDVTDRREFSVIVDDMMAVNDDIESLGRYYEKEGFIKTMGAAALAGFGEPIYMVPLGGQAARGAMTLSQGSRFLLTQGAKSAATFGAVNVASKKLIDETSYDLTNVEGAADELVVAAVGGGIGLVMPTAGYAVRHGLAQTVTALGNAGIPIPGPLPAWATRWGSEKHLRLMFRRMNEQQTPQLAQRATGEGADAALRQVGGTVLFDGERTNSVRILRQLIADANNGTFYEDLSIAPLSRLGDDAEIEMLVGQLRRAYQRQRQFIRNVLNPTAMAAGASPFDPDAYLISVQRHLAQDDYDRLNILRVFFQSDAARRALPGRNPLLQLFAAAGEAVPTVTGNTPANRSSQSTLLIHDLMRALIASPMDHTAREVSLRGTAQVSAEAAKEALELRTVAVFRRINNLLRENGLVQRTALTGRSDSGDQVMREAVDIILDRQNATANLPARVQVPNRTAVKIADLIEEHLQFMQRELVANGLFENDPMSGMKHYISLILDEQAFRANPEAARRALVAQYRMMDQQARQSQVRTDAIARAFDRTTDKNIRGEIIATVRTHLSDPSFSPRDGTEIRERLDDPMMASLFDESALPRQSRAAYRDSLEAIYVEGADAQVKRMTDPFAETSLFESVETAGNPDIFKQRSFRFVAPELRDFIVRDPVVLLGRYSAQASGQIGIARAIRLHPEVFGRLTYTAANGAERRVTDARSLLEYLGEVKNATERFVQLGGKRAMRGAQDAVDSSVADLQHMVKRLIGQVMYDQGSRPSLGTMFFSRNMGRYSMITNGGMIGVSSLGDLAGKFAWLAQHPIRGSRLMFEMIAPSARYLKKRDLEFLNLMSRISLIPRESTEYVLEQRGFGSGMVNRISGKLDQGGEMSARGFQRVNLFNTVDTANLQFGAAIAMDDLITLAKRLHRAQMSGAADPVAAARLSNMEAGRLARMGINTSNVRQVLEQIHRHGRYWNLERAGRQSFDDFVRSNRPVNPMLDQWDGALDDRRILMDSIPQEAMRRYNVTPGVGDRPISEDKYPLLRLVNQFGSYITAYNRQRLRPVLQGNAQEQGAWIGMSILLGWLLSATKNDLTKRQSFSDSLAELRDNPKAAMWSAMQDSAVLGSVMRPLGWLDGFGYGPSQYFRQNVAAGTFGAVARQRADRGLNAGEAFTALGGPSVQLIDKGIRSLTSPDSPRQDYINSQLSPLQNLVWARVLNRAGVSKKVHDTVGVPVPGLVPSDTLRPKRPTMRAR